MAGGELMHGCGLTFEAERLTLADMDYTCAECGTRWVVSGVEPEPPGLRLSWSSIWYTNS